MRLCFLISTCLGFIGLALLFGFFWNVDYNIVLHFDIFRGIDKLGSPMEAFLTFGMALAVNFLFIALAGYLKDREPFLAWALALSNIGLMALVLGAAVVIVINN